MSSNAVYSVTEDNFGGIYFRTARGIDRLNPVTGNIKRYTASDGLPAGDALGFRDRHGALWVTGYYEVARLVPEPGEQQAPSPVLITGLRVNGEVQPVADLGETCNLSVLRRGELVYLDRIEALGLDLVKAELRRIFRQSDPEFIALLNSIRRAELTPAGLARLNEGALRRRSVIQAGFS